jgi:hypothetical protein
MARTASIAAIRSGFSRAFTCAIATGIMSQARIFTRLAAFRETLEEIGSSDMLSSADVDYVRRRPAILRLLCVVCRHA